jgi:hypothetical protein
MSTVRLRNKIVTTRPPQVTNRLVAQTLVCNLLPDYRIKSVLLSLPAYLKYDDFGGMIEGSWIGYHPGGLNP